MWFYKKRNKKHEPDNISMKNLISVYNLGFELHGNLLNEVNVNDDHLALEQIFIFRLSGSQNCCYGITFILKFLSYKFFKLGGICRWFEF